MQPIPQPHRTPIRDLPSWLHGRRALHVHLLLEFVARRGSRIYLDAAAYQSLHDQVQLTRYVDKAVDDGFVLNLIDVRLVGRTQVITSREGI